MGPNSNMPKPAGHVDAAHVTVAPSTAVPDSNVRRALERLAGSTAAAQYVADLAYALGQVVRGETRKARLAARSAEERAQMAAQSAAVAIGGLHRLRVRVADVRLSAEEARARATQALAMSRDLRRRVSSDQIALTAQVFN